MRTPMVFCLSFALFAMGGGTSTRGCNDADELSDFTTPSSVRITPANPSIAVNGTQQFTAVVTFLDGHTEERTSSAAWSSSNTAVATIDTTGLANGVSAGTSTIRATVQDVSATTTLTVTTTQPAASMSGGPKSVIVTLKESSRSFGYVVDEAGDRLLLYVVVDRVLEPAGELRLAGGSRPVWLTVHPSGNYLYVLNQDAKSVSGFVLNAWSGAPHPMGSPFILSGRPEALEFDTAGDVATVSLLDSWDVQRFRIRRETGELVPVEAGEGPEASTQ
jgi:hypothetical protein